MDLRSDPAWASLAGARQSQLESRSWSCPRAMPKCLPSCPKPGPSGSVRWQGQNVLVLLSLRVGASTSPSLPPGRAAPLARDTLTLSALCLLRVMQRGPREGGRGAKPRLRLLIINAGGSQLSPGNSLGAPGESPASWPARAPSTPATAHRLYSHCRTSERTGWAVPRDYV